jgi:hypothetical protein
MAEVARPGHDGLRAARFRKSSWSSGAQECVDVGHAGDLAGVKDTKNGHVVLAFPAGPWAQFLTAAKIGQFDH